MTPPFAYAIFYLKGIVKPEWGIETAHIIRGGNSIWYTHNGRAGAVHSFSSANPLVTAPDDKVLKAKGKLTEVKVC